MLTLSARQIVKNRFWTFFFFIMMVEFWPIAVGMWLFVLQTWKLGFVGLPTIHSVDFSHHLSLVNCCYFKFGEFQWVVREKWSHLNIQPKACSLSICDRQFGSVFTAKMKTPNKVASLQTQFRLQIDLTKRFLYNTISELREQKQKLIFNPQINSRKL